MGLIQTAKAPFVSLSLSVLRREHFPPEIASPIMMLQHTWRLFSKTWIPTPGNVPAHHCGSIGGGAFPKWITIVSSAQHNLAFYHTDQPMSVWDPPLQSNQTSIFWTEANHINREVPKELQQSSQNVQMFYSNIKHDDHDQVHHEWTAPIALATDYCHPLEHALVNVLPNIAYAIIIGSDPFSYLYW